MKLKKIDLSKGQGHNHPDIKIGVNYLAVRDGGWMAAGIFDRQWYGLHFDGFHSCGLQFDTPGTNYSDWKELYEIVK